MKRVAKSRQFAVVLVLGNTMGAYFICRRTEQEDAEEAKTFLDINAYQSPWPPAQKDALIELLVKAGLTVRFYDPEEQQWMDNSLSYGYVRAPGNRDGTWGPPATVEEFEENYLRTL